MTRARREMLANLGWRITQVIRQHPVRVAIDGVDAAGKTTLADELVDVLSKSGRPVIRASIDGFHNPRATRRRRGALSPEGYFHDSFNYVDLVKMLLEPLGPGGSRIYRRAVFDFRTDTVVAASAETAPSNAVLLLDGVFLLRQELRQHFDFSVFVRADFTVTLLRAEKRDVGVIGDIDEVRQRYEERYIPGQKIYLSLAQPERWASVVIDNNDPEAPRIHAGANGDACDSQ